MIVRLAAEGLLAVLAVAGVMIVSLALWALLAYFFADVRSMLRRVWRISR